MKLKIKLKSKSLYLFFIKLDVYFINYYYMWIDHTNQIKSDLVLEMILIVIELFLGEDELSVRILSWCQKVEDIITGIFFSFLIKQLTKLSKI